MKIMGLYVLGDTHLSIGKDKPMDIFGEVWKNHTQKLEEGFSELRDDDLTVLCGDISWGMGIEDCLADFQFIDHLPGRKIILKGNHDYWWTTASKAYKFFQLHGITTIDILNNNSYLYDKISLCGTRGWFYEEEKNGAHDKKIMQREILRLKTSLESAADNQKLVFLHYPPIYMNYECREILELLKEYNVRLCCYGHLHGKSMKNSFNGWYDGTEFKLVSADYINFKPIRIL